MISPPSRATVLLRNAALFLSLFALLGPLSARAASGTGGGTIYFEFAGRMNTMTSDGANKYALPSGIHGEPSRLLHGGHRWFLTYEAIVGETYTDGSQRLELFAIRDDNAWHVQLTDQPDLKPFPAITAGRWGVGDQTISWIAARLVDGVVTAGGIYSASIIFDEVNGATLVAEPSTPILPAPIINHPGDGGLRPIIRSHDWSPDGQQIVFDTFAPENSEARLLYVATLSSGSFYWDRPLSTSTSAAWPVWSPANSRIAYQRWQFRGGIATITPTGTGETLIVPPPSQTSVTTPVWSPTGTHLLYRSSNLSTGYGQDRNDVYRAQADGGKKTNLTKDLNTSFSAFAGNGHPAYAIGWR
jgi:hypothetical protein